MYEFGETIGGLDRCFYFGHGKDLYHFDHFMGECWSCCHENSVSSDIIVTMSSHHVRKTILLYPLQSVHSGNEDTNAVIPTLYICSNLRLILNLKQHDKSCSIGSGECSVAIET